MRYCALIAPRDGVADDEPRAVRVREDNEPSLLGHAPEQGELFLVFEYTEPVGRENRGIDERFKGDLIVPSLDDKGFLVLSTAALPRKADQKFLDRLGVRDRAVLARASWRTPRTGARRS